MLKGSSEEAEEAERKAGGDHWLVRSRSRSMSRSSSGREEEGTDAVTVAVAVVVAVNDVEGAG